MGIDASSQIILTSGRAPGIGAEHVLTKVHVLNLMLSLMILCNLSFF